MLFGAFVVVLFAFETLLPSSEIARLVDIPVISLVAALISAGLAAIFRFKVADSFLRASLIIVFGFAMVSIATLLYFGDTGSMTVVPLWFLLAFISTVIYWGYGLLFVVIGGLYLFVLMLDKSLSFDLGAGIIYTTMFPVLVGWIIWGRHSIHYRDSESQHANDLHKLTSQLSQISGKADIVINAIDDGVIAVNNDGVIELINPAAQRIIGWGKQDAVGLSYISVLKLVDDKDHKLTKATDPIEQVILNNQQVETDKLTLITNSGKRLLISLVVSPVGQLGQGAIIVFRDITAKRKEELEQTEFISTASHEMRTPVASIEGYLGLALNPATATIDDRAREFITKAHASAQHLGHLFQDLLDITKSDDGRMSNLPRVVEVVPFVGDIVEGLTPKATEKSLTIKFPPTTSAHDTSRVIGTHLNPAYFIHVDRDHLREVVANLIENAIKYTPAGTVTVNVDGDANHVRVSITDTGIGIPKEDQDHLFQKFYRIDNSDTREIGGTGLGLYLCRALTEQMGGKIWVDSQYGEGSTFTVEFPRLSPEDARRFRQQEDAEDAQQRAEEAKQAAQAAAETKIQESAAPITPTPAPAVASPVATPVAPVAPTVSAAPPTPPSTSIPVSSTPTPPQNLTLSAIESDKARYTIQRGPRPNIPERK